MRVVSLVPSVTETLLAWGIEPVAVTRFCEQPGLRAVGGTKNPDIDAIVELAPELIVMNDEENRVEDADALRAAGMAIHVVHVESLEDVTAAMHDLRARLDHEPDDTSGAAAVASTAPVPEPSRLAAFIPIWRRPWMTLNRRTYGSSLLEAIGVRNVFADADERYPTVTLDEVSARRPDVVLAPSEPYPFRERHAAELEDVAPVEFVDGQDLFWWGARTPQAQERLRRRLLRVGD